MRLSDTRGEIRAAYSALLEVVPTHIMTRYYMLVTSYGFNCPCGQVSAYGNNSNSVLKIGHCIKNYKTKRAITLFYIKKQTCSNFYETMLCISS